jgi:hypothetical protein
MAAGIRGDEQHTFPSQSAGDGQRFGGNGTAQDGIALFVNQFRISHCDRPRDIPSERPSSFRGKGACFGVHADDVGVRPGPETHLYFGGKSSLHGSIREFRGT